MNKKTVFVILEIIPVLSAIISLILIIIPYGSTMISYIVPITFLLAFLGFIFFFIGRKFYKDNKIIRILGICDLLSTASIIAIYIIAIFAFGL